MPRSGAASYGSGGWRGNGGVGAALAEAGEDGAGDQLGAGDVAQAGETVEVGALFFVEVEGELDAPTRMGRLEAAAARAGRQGAVGDLLGGALGRVADQGLLVLDESADHEVGVPAGGAPGDLAELVEELHRPRHDHVAAPASWRVALGPIAVRRAVARRELAAHFCGSAM